MVTSGSTMVSSVVATTAKQVSKQKSSSLDETGKYCFIFVNVYLYSTTS